MIDLPIVPIAALLILFGLAILFLITYKVIPPNEAHVVVVMGKGKRIYAPTKDRKSAYFFIPFLMQRFELPLANVKMDIGDIHLHDIKIAPFLCDVITWLHISDPDRAAERLSLSAPFDSLQKDLNNLVQAVARAVAMKQEVLDIMRDRATFAGLVSKEVGNVLGTWGVELINLEVNDIRDDSTKGSTVISDYESIRKADVNATARKEVSIRNREAVEVEQENRQKELVAEAVADETSKKRQIEKDKVVGIAEQERVSDVAKATEKANEQQIAAARRLEVGKAQVVKEAAIERANGEAEAIRIMGEKEANVVQLKGEAEGKAIEAKGLAEASAKDKMAEAMKKYNDAATTIEKIQAMIEIEKAKYHALGQALSNADLKIVQSGEGGSIFGFPLNAKTGADLGQMLEGLDLSTIVNKIKK